MAIKDEIDKVSNVLSSPQGNPAPFVNAMFSSMLKMMLSIQIGSDGKINIPGANEFLGVSDKTSFPIIKSFQVDSQSLNSVILKANVNVNSLQSKYTFEVRKSNTPNELIDSITNFISSPDDVSVSAEFLNLNSLTYRGKFILENNEGSITSDTKINLTNNNDILYDEQDSIKIENELINKKLISGAAPTRQPIFEGFTIEIVDVNLNFVGDEIIMKLINLFYDVFPKMAKRFNSPWKNVKLWFNSYYSGPIAGTIPNFVFINPEYIKSNPNDLDVFTHELMHIVQSYNKQDSTFSWNPRWITEGLADYGRNLYGQYNHLVGFKLDPLYVGHHYTEGYKVTAAFFVWLENKYPIILDNLNTLMQKRNEYYDDSFWVKETGKTIDTLWSEYGVEIISKTDVKEKQISLI